MNNVYLPTVATGFRPVRPAPQESPKQPAPFPADVAERIQDYMEFNKKDRNHDGVLTFKEYNTEPRTLLAGTQGSNEPRRPSADEIRERIQKAMNEVGKRVWLR